ncbi:HAD-IIB family hydrolase [Parasphingorhabdus sp.]|uniref:HAD-IIB family hydrolase n=1 Tax=Parasphingorhabdus sp. TaxID=2709688 RepID=UPI003593C800
MATNRPLFPVIFTDLDGTLLDHDSYSAKPADRLIRQISEQSIGAVVPVTSKTRAELRALQRSIPLPLSIGVSENGSVIYAPDGYPFINTNEPQIILLGIEYSGILDRIDNLPKNLRQHIIGFSDMSGTELSKVTGLELNDALLAKRREASEPFLWSGSDAELEELNLIMADFNIRIQRGGRFYHFTGQATKDLAMARIMGAFTERTPRADIISIALGDGPNDLGMIEAADIGVIMPNPEGVTIQSCKSHVRTASMPGPRGWAMAVAEIIVELGVILPER